jgi:FKBP-type peptidyl-prolyl cis-trans isomerase FklB
MRTQSIAPRIALFTGLIAALACSQSNAAPSHSLATDEQQQAYSLGAAVATQMRRDLGDIDAEAFVSGVADVMNETEVALSPEQMASALAHFEEQRVGRAKEEMAARAEANRTEGEAFRAEFAAEENVVSLENGLLYKVLDSGDGKVPSADSTVTVHYRGKLVDGSEFDSSYANDEPATFPLERVMPGFSQALTRMPEGSKWQVVIPPELAYGEHGAGPIGPNATLVFELELISAG